MKELEGVTDISHLWLWLKGYNVKGIIIPTPSIKNVVKEFLQGRHYYQPTWRAMIFALDGARETRVANRIRHYAEPVQGRYMLCD